MKGVMKKLWQGGWLCVLLAQFLRAEPVILGAGKERFELGNLLAADDFADLSRWVVQVQEVDGAPTARVEVKGGALDCYLPQRGATIWFREKLRTRLTITYEVVCPVSPEPVKGLIPRDINNFWLASDPSGGDLFDARRYTGDFSTYDRMHGYYASTGGRKNETTRLRRYPREREGAHARHLLLNARDEQPAFLICPDEVMRIQLVAFDDLLQYVVDGKLVYECQYGDPIQVEVLAEKGKKITREARYKAADFPFYKEGYFGFRMVGTHHIYRKFRLHELRPKSP